MTRTYFLRSRAAFLGLGLALIVPAVAMAGAPLKGVDVKLGKNPGGGAQARMATDQNGNANFGVLPAGQYFITIDMPAKPATPVGGAARTAAPDTGVSVDIDGATGGALHRALNGAAARQASPSNPINFQLDGRKALVVSLSSP